METPLIAQASVLGQVQAQRRDKKIIVFKYKRKTRYRKKMGHRQSYTRLAITSIVLDGEEIGVQGWPQQWITAQAETPIEEVSAEFEDDGLFEEISDEVEEEPSMAKLQMSSRVRRP